jgi:hypothetical protein
MIGLAGDVDDALAGEHHEGLAQDALDRRQDRALHDAGEQIARRQIHERADLFVPDPQMMGVGELPRHAPEQPTSDPVVDEGQRDERRQRHQHGVAQDDPVRRRPRDRRAHRRIIGVKHGPMDPGGSNG